MPGLNKVMLIGNLTRDPELRVTPKGTPICVFSLAINRKVKTDSGEQREEVIYVEIEAWGKQGETIAKYTAKGKPLYVEGRLKLDTWEDRNTKEKRSRMKVVLEQFQFLGAASEPTHTGASPSAGQETQERYAPPSRAAAAKPAPQENLDEDVPF